VTINRIGILTGGGDCPGLNAVIRAVVHGATARGWEVMGIEDATSGLVDLSYRSPHGNRLLTLRDVDDILVKGGTILGTSNRSDPFRFVVETDGEQVETDVSDRVVENYHTLGLDALISIGGDGSMDISNRLIAKGLKIVGVPKTIDRDLGATDTTFGFSTAVQTATECVDRIQDTAESHDRVMIVEVMGRHAGHIALHTAIAGGAHVCTIPEIPYRVEPIAAQIRKRRGEGHPFSVCVVAEGSRPVDGEEAYTGPREKGAMRRLLGAGARLAAALHDKVKLDVRVTVLGHLQRGGTPVQFDRILGTRFGVKAVELVEEGKFGYMAALRALDVVGVPLAEALVAQAFVDPQGQMVSAAKAVGICFGD
jgi:ATP-dependent phosphofructokinase / diphosphate-dependent phosphofructokinase